MNGGTMDNNKPTTVPIPKEKIPTTSTLAPANYNWRRVLGVYRDSEKADGPLLITMGGIHGNEPAGILALEKVFRQLEKYQPRFKGTFIGVSGNVSALRANKRFIDTDLNRQWHNKRANYVMNTPTHQLETVEDQEQKALLLLFGQHKKRFKKDYTNRNMMLLDLHTFSAAKGGAYSIATSVGKSLHWASQLSVPTITGMENVIQGTTMHFFNDMEMVSFCFEAGQHNDPVSVERMEAAIWLTLRNIGCIRSEDVPNLAEHEACLYNIGKNLPKIVEFLYRHGVEPSDNFKMKPGYTNFMRVSKGEVLASDRQGDIKCPYDGMILMPLYQPQGEDGFFIVKPIA